MPTLRALATREILRLVMRGARRGDDVDPSQVTPDAIERGVKNVRERLNGATRFARLPGTVTATPAEGPVAGEWVAPGHAVPGRTVLLLHGGGYVAGSPETHRGLAAALGMYSSAAVLVPDYRLAPEHRYPAALDDVVAVYRWLIGPGGQDPSRLVVAGDSAGGGLALALLVRLRDEGVELPAGAALLSPWADLTGTSESVSSLDAADPWLSGSLIGVTGEVYAPGGTQEPYASPVFADLSGLPPLLVHVGSEEVLLDDARTIVARARAAGTEASLGVFDGMWHVFHAFTFLPEARRALREVAGFVRRLTGEHAEAAGG